MAFDAFSSLDAAVFDALSSLRTPFFDAVMSCVTTSGDAGAVWLVLGMGLSCFSKTRTTGVLVLIAVAATFIVSTLGFKHLFARPRPCVLFPNAVPFYPCPSGYSFPSGHTVSSFAAAGVLLFRRVKGRFAALVWAVLIGFSRIYLNAHYFTDVLTGCLLGLGAAWLTVRLHAMKKAEF